MIITMEHIRQAKMCSRGTRKFFQSNGLDWSDFLKNGIEEEKLASTGDAMALRVIEVAHGEE